MISKAQLCLDILPLPQKRIFPALSQTPGHFVLYGGTAIALRLGHRESIDFDFFSPEPFDPDTLYQQIPYLKGSEILQKELNTLTCLVDQQGPVKFSFFGGLSLDYVCDPELIDEPVIKIASLIDLSGMKMAVIQKRATLKDYLDIYALLTIAHIDLLTALAAASIIYDKQFNPYISLKALTYFEEGDLETLDQSIRDYLLKCLQSLNIEQIEQRILDVRQLRKRVPC